MIACDPFAVNTLASSILSLCNKLIKSEALPRVTVPLRTILLCMLEPLDIYCNLFEISKILPVIGLALFVRFIFKVTNPNILIFFK